MARNIYQTAGAPGISGDGLYAGCCAYVRRDRIRFTSTPRIHSRMSAATAAALRLIAFTPGGASRSDRLYPYVCVCVCESVELTREPVSSIVQMLAREMLGKRYGEKGRVWTSFDMHLCLFNARRMRRRRRLYLGKPGRGSTIFIMRYCGARA